MSTFRLRMTLSIMAVTFALILLSLSFALYDVPGKETTVYTPVIEVVPDHDGKGFIRISADGAVLWVETSETAKPHLQHLPVGSLIDLKILFRGKPNTPLIQSWKVTSGDSACHVFDGKSCSK